MMPSRTSPARSVIAPLTPCRVVIVTLDQHLARVTAKVAALLADEHPGLVLSLHAAADWESNPGALERCKADIARGDIIIANMLFLEDQIRAIKPTLEARRDHCDALIVQMSAAEMVRLTRVGSFDMSAPQSGAMALLKKLKPSRKPGETSSSSGANQMAMLRRLPKILKLIPGKAQDVRAYFLTLHYWLGGSEDNLGNMVRYLISRYADGERKSLRERMSVAPPIDYPDVGLFHPRLPGGIAESIEALPPLAGDIRGTVGVVVLRSYVLANDAAHYAGVVTSLEAAGLRAIAVFASGLDARPAIERFFFQDGRPTIDALVSLTGFSLVGGPAYSDAAAAKEILARLDVPYIAAQPVEFQTLESWSSSGHGLSPVEATIMVALPELDGAIAPTVFGGRSDGPKGCAGCVRDCKTAFAQPGAEIMPGAQMQPCLERCEKLALRLLRMVTLRRAEAAQRKLAIVLFNFPPNSGATGTAAYLAVFASLFNCLTALRREGYDVEVPDSVDALRDLLLLGNSAIHGTDANVHAQIAVDDYVRAEPHLAQIEGQWGPAPGRVLSNGRSIHILGRQFGKVFVGLQPGFGYEGDPMRLLFESGFTPTHAFSAFYRYLREDFAAHALLHFGTHGAIEFMPGKQAGPHMACWPDRLIGDLPNFYFYAANNPSEGALAKRRINATLISYLTPPVGRSGLYKGLVELKGSIDRYLACDPAERNKRDELAALIRDQADALSIENVDWQGDQASAVERLAVTLYEYEQSLIPDGLHIIGQVPSVEARAELLQAMAEAHHSVAPALPAMLALVNGASPEKAQRLSGLPNTAEVLAVMRDLQVSAGHLARDYELDAMLHALAGGYMQPVTGGDLLRTPAILPTGRNLHGFDPFALPSVIALKHGAAQAQLILDRHRQEGGALPETVAFVLWGTDNLKSEGEPIAQVLALMGAKARFDSYGRLCGAELLPLESLGRPRIDVITTLSGIFRDLLPLQTKMLADAAFLAASADEPVELNFVRKHALAYQQSLGCDLETAALRVFSNADGAYGANVNQMIDAGCWQEEDELADAYEARKCFAYGRNGKPSKQQKLLGQALKTVDLAYQNLDSLELGVTTVDHYVDTLGGMTRSVRRAKGSAVNVYVGDNTQGAAKVRTLAEQVTLETRTRTLNPRWYDGMLKHGYEGVRQIEAQVTNTMGWSATTNQVAPWIYQQISETFVLDPDMRARLMDLNPKASARMANRLIEAYERKFWTPDAETLAALRQAGDDIEDRLEGVVMAAE